MIRSILLSAVVTVVVVPAALAQAPASASSDASRQNEVPEVSDVVVTGSRIVANGFQEPTPVTVVGAQEFDRQMPITISSYLNDLPSFGATTSATNPTVGVAGGGEENLNLRNLGITRTLVLLDDRRVVDSAITGGVDVVTLPMGLISRVEVVTGGASAAWGSDAVAGVVNFVLNHNYQGLEARLEGGISERGDDQNSKLSIIGGHQFFDGRLRVIASFDYSNSPQGVDLKDRSDWFHSLAIVNNPRYTATNGQPRQITVANAAPALISTGGVITSGPLAGTQFVGPNGTPIPYNFGTQSGLLQYGGDVDNSVGENRAITTALKYENVFTHVDFDINDKVTAFAEFAYGGSQYTENGYLFYFRQGSITIQPDNAFLDPALASLTGGQPFSYGYDFTQGGPPTSTNSRNVFRGVIGLKGKIGESWSWNAYYTHGDAETRLTTHNDVIIANYNNAIDSVRNPATGSIVCRSTLTNPNNGCVPLDLFGTRAASPQALNYVLGTDWQQSDVQLDVVEADATGPVHTLPAGDISAAAGIDYMKNQASSTENPEAAARAYAVENFQPFYGQRDVKEAFAETDIPILKDLPGAEKLELNAAVRETDYSTSGAVTTWKVGLSDQATNDLRVRATFSRDIRAPTLSELFTGGTFTQQVVFDPLTQKSYPQYTNAQGNPDLKPEDASTTTVGFVYTPSYVRGLALSIDYYRIKITGAIASVSAPLELQYCYSGQTSYCPYILRDSTGAITQINTEPVNEESQLTYGYDFEADYKHELGPGYLTIRALATYTPVFTQTDTSGDTIEFAGQIGDLNPGEPKLKANLFATYEQGQVAVNLNMRWVGAARIQNDWTTGVDVDNNHVPNYITFGFSTQYKFTAKGMPADLTFAIDNMFNKAPYELPVMPGTVPYEAPGMGGRFDLYDYIGRSYRLGLHVKL